MARVPIGPGEGSFACFSVAAIDGGWSALANFRGRECELLSSEKSLQVQIVRKSIFIGAGEFSDCSRRHISTTLSFPTPE